MHVLQLFLLTTAVAICVDSSDGEGCPRRVCYYYSTGHFKSNEKQLLKPETIDPFLCTHIVYCSADVYLNDLTLEHDFFTIEETNSLYTKVLALKQNNTDLKVLINVDGKLCRRKPFFNFYFDYKRRQTFIGNMIKYVRKYQFDGFNIRCMFYGQILTGMKAEFANFMAEIRTAVDKEAGSADRLIFSLDVMGIRSIDDNYYDVGKISQNVDWINMLAYGLLEITEYTTGHHSPLYSDASIGQKYSADQAVEHWLERNTPRDKIVVGFPSFGNSFRLANDLRIGPAVPYYWPRKGNYTVTPGFLAYYEVCSYFDRPETTIWRLAISRVPYLISKDDWVGFDDITSVAEKMIYIKDGNLGGFAIDSLDMDDCKELCGQGLFPLLKAANDECDR